MNTQEHLDKKFGPHTGNPHRLKGIERPEMYKLFAELGFTVGLETGIEKGKNATVMYNNIPNLKLYGLDSYKQHPQASYVFHADRRNWNTEAINGWKDQCIERMKGRNYVAIEKFTEDAIHDIEDNSLDFVYLDADHSYDFTMQDIILWGRKLRKGGIMSGHDYFYEKGKRREKVKQAVDDYTNVHGIKFYITDEDHDAHASNLNGDYYPSWFFVKLDHVWPNVII